MNNVIGQSNSPIESATIPNTRDVLSSLLTRLRSLAARAEPVGQSALLLALRLLYGWFFIQTGWGKWTNFSRTVEFFASLHLPGPKAMAALVASTELVGGLLLAVGVATRYAAAILVVVLGTAFATAHAADAFSSLTAFTEQPPYPFLVATLILLAFGAGRFSMDGWLRSRASQKRTGSVRIH